jgi:hypothetical protein
MSKARRVWHKILAIKDEKWADAKAERIISEALDAERERCVDKVQAFFMNPPGDLDKFLAPSIAYTCRGFLVKAIRAGEEEDA